MGKKVTTTIRIDEEVLKKAKAFGLNISKTCENLLKMEIDRLERFFQGKENTNSSKKEWCGGRDLNPRRPTPEDLKSSPLS